jgi:hypothetical protein
MIGVVCGKKERQAFDEFFQLFKTPWEFARAGQSYQVLISTQKDVAFRGGQLLMVFSTEETAFDQHLHANVRFCSSQATVEWGNVVFPVYGNLASFEISSHYDCLLRSGTEITGFSTQLGDRRVIRIGYNLAAEIRFLLADGQPNEHALQPTLDFHIELLRRCIASSGICFVEVMPIPAGYDFICCLTHDVDFAGIRRQKFDRTVLGFLYRALFDSLRGLVRRKRSWRQVCSSWKAALSLPLIYLGLIPDIWESFEDYLTIEADRKSTFFLIPFRGRPGTDKEGKVDKRRAVSYQAGELKSEIDLVLSRGCEIALHGLEAWRDLRQGVEEIKQISTLTKQPAVGVRIHWLYFDKESPSNLEKAGVVYDSTVGYNDAVGYRAGTSQVYQLPNTEGLLELPLHIQDTALFYSSRMGLSEVTAWALCAGLISNAKRFGGVLTINWHGRSLAPERLWGDFYVRLLDKMGEHRVWFTTAREATAWFRARREIAFQSSSNDQNSSIVKVLSDQEIKPSIVIRRYGSDYVLKGSTGSGQTDFVYTGQDPLEISVH